MEFQQTPVHIYLVDDHQLFLDGLVRILKDEPERYVARAFKTAEELFHGMNGTVPAMVVLDVQLPGMDGIAACKRIKSLYPEVNVLFVSMFESPQVVADCREAGANGYISKTSDAKTVKEAVKSVLRGEAVFMEQVSPPAIARERVPVSPYLLTRREKEIVGLIKQGKSSRAIAGVLSISEFTVETHRRNIAKKLGLKSVAELIAFAYQHGM